jgi:hypothetical protein
MVDREVLPMGQINNRECDTRGKGPLHGNQQGPGADEGRQAERHRTDQHCSGHRTEGGRGECSAHHWGARLQLCRIRCQHETLWGRGGWGAGGRGREQPHGGGGGQLHGGGGDNRRDGQLDTREWGGIVSVGAGGARGDAFPAATSASVSLRTQPLTFAQATKGIQALSTALEIRRGQGDETSTGRAGGDLGRRRGVGGKARGRERAVTRAVAQSARHDPRVYGWHRALARSGTVE